MAIVVWLIVAEALYVRALRVLGGRGVRVPRWQIACWHLGLALQAVALLSPIGVARRRAAHARTWPSTC